MTWAKTVQIFRHKNNTSFIENLPNVKEISRKLLLLGAEQRWEGECGDGARAKAEKNKSNIRNIEKYKLDIRKKEKEKWKGKSKCGDGTQA